MASFAVSGVFTATTDLSLIAPLSFARNLPSTTFSGTGSLRDFFVQRHTGDAVGYIYENIGIEIVPSDPNGMGYVYENVGVELVTSPEAYGYVYEGDVNTTNPYPHLWHVTPNESPYDMQATIYGSGFNHPTVKVFFGTQDDWTGVEPISVDHQWVAGIPQTVPASALAYGASRSIPIDAEPNVQYSKITVDIPFPEGNTFDQIRIQITYTDVLTSNPLDFQILVTPSFVKRFNPASTDITLFAGSETEQLGATNDGTAETARFRRAYELTNLTDGTQRKMVNESWNRWYVMDRSSIRMIHPCEEDFIVAEPVPEFSGYKINLYEYNITTPATWHYSPPYDESTIQHGPGRTITAMDDADPNPEVESTIFLIGPGEYSGATYEGVYATPHSGNTSAIFLYKVNTLGEGELITMHDSFTVATLGPFTIPDDGLEYYIMTPWTVTVAPNTLLPTSQLTITWDGA